MPAPREGLEGVDRSDAADLSPIRRWARSARLWLTDPAAWSARRYRDSSAMHFVAVTPQEWRKPDDP